MTRATAREAIRQYYWGGPYLLDTYTGASFAYSFRRLRKTYYGPMVRLRDTTSDAEKDFGTNNLGVFDAAGVAAWLGGHSAAVARLYDQSGGATLHDAFQPTSGLQPAYAASPDRVVYTAASAQGFQIDSYSFVGLSLTYSAHIQVANTAAARSILNSNGNGVQWRIENTEQQVVNKQFVSLVATSNTSVAVNTPQYVAYTAGYNGSAWDAHAFYLEGAPDGTSSTSVAFSASNTLVGRNGGGEDFDGSMFEVIGWPSVFSSGDIAALKTGYY